MSMPGAAAVTYVRVACSVQFPAELSPIHAYWMVAILPGYIYSKCSFAGVTDLWTTSKVISNFSLENV
jgi:hypothetical protein